MLRPLPVLERQWREISINFIGPLPTSKKCKILMVITDRLSKGVILEGCENTETEHIVDLLIKRFYQYHGVPSAIILDQGGQFVSHL